MISSKLFKGIYSHNLEMGHLIIPRKVNQLGEHLSHNLTHFHQDNEDEEKLHYHISFDNQTFHIELQ